MSNTLGFVVATIAFFAIVSGFLSLYYEDTTINPEASLSYEDNFNSTNAGTIDELFDQYGLLQASIEEIPFGEKISYFIITLGVIIVIFVVRGI
jgi:hypothetical protein